jgi:putative SOS response-associated peptidase YedK
MCYDISFTINIRQLSDYFPDLVFDEQIEIDFKPVHIIGHNYGNHPIIYKNREDEKLHCRLMEWGCIPFYVKDEDAYKKQRATMLNARSERILEDPKSYWYKIRNRRCLIPMTGFYEHRGVKGLKKKIPYFINLKDQETFFLPGLYSVTELPNKDTGEIEKRYSFTIITRAANKLMEQIHNGGANKHRMPLTLPFKLSKQWVSEELTEAEYKEILAYEMPVENMDYKTVFSIRTTVERQDNKEKNELYIWEGVSDITI